MEIIVLRTKMIVKTFCYRYQTVLYTCGGVAGVAGVAGVEGVEGVEGAAGVAGVAGVVAGGVAGGVAGVAGVPGGVAGGEAEGLLLSASQLMVGTTHAGWSLVLVFEVHL